MRSFSISIRRFGRVALIGAAFLGALGLMAASFLLVAAREAYETLPSLEAMTDYRPKVPLRVYTREGELVGEFGEERRRVAKIDEIPLIMRQALLAAEDDRFYEHHGVDPQSVARAAWNNFRGGSRQGASTLTQQVARNFFLTTEKTFTRKFFEALLAFKIESQMSKDQILEVYMNQIYLGQRAYGFASAAQVYFGKPLSGLSLGEAAMLAGLPKAPSAYNPVVNFERAKKRQVHILRRMGELGYVSSRRAREAALEKLVVVSGSERFRAGAGAFSLRAEHAAEMARQFAIERFGDQAYERGLRVTLTLRGEDQRAAHAAAREGLLGYDRKRGYRGPEGRVKLPAGIQALRETVEEALAQRPASEGLLPAVVVEASAREVSAMLANGETVSIRGEGLAFASSWLPSQALRARSIEPGSILRVARLPGAGGWEISQLPEAAVAFVSADARDGSIRALVGGFDFNLNKFNRVAQAWRQPGSAFKPFIYAAALEKGIAPGSLISDGPFFHDPGDGSPVWSPKNYDGKHGGLMTLRQALTQSKNMVTARVMERVGPLYAQDYVSRFGFDPQRSPPFLTMALGAGSVTPLQLAAAYATFANGGYRVEPYLIERVVDAQGSVLYEAHPAKAGQGAARVIDERVAFLMDSMLQDVASKGTAAKASAALKRSDLAGKTGTTNDAFDAWFAGYHPDVVAVAWMGFDQPKSLGDRETGGGVALPIWIDYMKTALKGVAQKPRGAPPEGVSTSAGDYHLAEFAPEPLNPAPRPPAPESEEGDEMDGDASELNEGSASMPAEPVTARPKEVLTEIF
jgi:penicillin-binding protein 1A